MILTNGDKISVDYDSFGTTSFGPQIIQTELF